MEDEPNESCGRTNNNNSGAKERLRLIKEERKKQHEERLGRGSLFPAGLAAESDTIKRFSKYRRSGNERAVRKAANLESSLVQGSDGDNSTESVSRTEIFPGPDPSREDLWNVSPVYVPGSSKDTEEMSPPVFPNPVKSSRDGSYNDGLTISLAPSPMLTASLSLDQSKGVLRKPAIPAILRSATEPGPGPTFSSEDTDNSVMVKKPSILKRKDDSSNTVTPSSSSSSGGQSASVSFGLPVTTNMLSRTKSIDSNLSGDTETGYWSGGESVGGILKSRRCPSDGDSGDQSSIMKSRRSSFGSSVASSSNSGSEGGLQSILKRKLSYDSSYIMKEASGNEYSFSTHSLPACGCLSPEPKPILKKKSNSEDLDEQMEPKPILKHRSSRGSSEHQSEVIIEPEKTIKPCLKKSSSKSVDEGFSSACVNFSPSFPLSVSPVSASEGIYNSRSILKRSGSGGGILKNAWRESASTSTSSSSSELDNSRSGQVGEDYSFLLHSSTPASSQGLERARRHFRSEGDIHNEDGSSSDCIIDSRAQSAVPPGSSATSSFDAPAAAVENGLLVSNLLHRPSRNYDEDDDDPREDFVGEEEEKNKEASDEKVSRSNSGERNSTTTRSSLLPVTSSFDSLQTAATAPAEQDYFFSARKKLNSVKKRVSPSPPSVPARRSVEDVIVPAQSILLSYKLSPRRTSLGSGYPANNSSSSPVSDYSSFLSNIASCAAAAAGVPVSPDSYERSLEEDKEPLKDISSSTRRRNEEKNNAVSTKNNYEWCNETGKRGLSSSSDSSQIRRNVVASSTTDGEHLSVAQRRSLFMQLESDEPRGKSVKHVETEGDLVTSASSSSSSSSSSSRSKRHTTQPITTNEVEKAAANFIVQNVTLAATVNQRTKNHPADHTFHSKENCLESHKLSDFNPTHCKKGPRTMESLGQEAEGEEDFVHDQASSSLPLTSKPPTGAGGLKKTRTEESFVARLARIHNERARVEISKSLMPFTTLPRTNTTTTRLIPRDRLSRVSPAVAVPAMMVPLISITTTTTHEEEDEPVGSSSSSSSGPKSLKDRIRMFDSLASTIQSEYKAARKKSVTSKRFLTQPVSMTSDQLERYPSKDKCNYEIGPLPSLPLSCSYDDDDDAEEEDEDNVPRDTRTSAARPVALATGRRTVRSKEGQIEDELSECSSQSLGGIPTATSSAQHSFHSDSGEEKDKSDRCSQEEEEDEEESTSPPLQGSSNSVRSHSPEEEEREDSEGEMPEKIQSDDSAGSSNDEASTDLYVDTSCVKRRLKSKDGSSPDNNSMMMSPESEVNLFGKGSNKVNRNSIADKIAALQTNGEISWKKRVIKINPDYPDKAKPTLTDQNDNVEIRKNNVVELRKNNRDTSVIANRLSQLESSQERWKARVGENDANIFTVQGRLERAGKITKGSTSSDGPGSPPKESKVKSLGAKVIAPIRFKTNSKDGGSPSSSPKEEIPPKVKQQTTEPVEIIGANKTTRKQYSRSDTASSGEGSEEEKIVVCSVVENDNETFSRFFNPISDSGSRKQQQLGGRQAGARLGNVQIDESSFKAIQSESGKLGGLRKNVKVPRNHSSTKNPVRSLALRLQKQSYTELSPQVREKEMKKRMQIDNLTKNAPLSVEALAGLASKEDFTAVKLKKANGNEQRAKDFPHPMLILIKGKRQVQTRVVAPEVTSLSSGDNYILVTANKVYQFIGEYSNRLERAKIADVVSHIVTKKDLGCRIGSMTEVGTLEEPLIGGRDQSEFFRLLGSGGVESVPDSEDDLGDENDEAYESGIVSTNRVFEVDQVKGELVPLSSSGCGGGWGTQPRFGLLQDDKVLVFDFITEVYVWSASKADPELKKTAYRLAKDMFEGEYEEPEDCEDKRLSRPFEGSQRPNWCFLKKINQHMEPILFIEKFFDWPDDSGRLIKVQQLKKNSDSSLKEGNYNFNPCDVEEMLRCFEDVPEPELELEGFNVGRGTEVRNYEDRRTFQITTLNVKAWNISEFSKCDVDSSALGQFYSEEAYVIRWQFSVSQIGRDLKGNISKHSGVLGRERCTYFFWQGKNSRITEQGTSALMTVELDSEKGPQVRVEQGREPPAFLNLFQGLMFVHLESREATVKDMKLYVAMGAAESEGHFIEVACQASSFRSLGSFILVDCVKGRVYLWHGKLSDSVSRKIAVTGAAAIVDSPQRYINVHGSFRLIEMEEGGESALFFNCLGGLNAKKFLTEYCSLRDQRLEQYAETKVYMFSSIQGAFEANPVLSIKRKADSPEAFPILQEELYTAQQPRLFLISRGPETWLWQGWQPLGDEENENTATGSGEIRWGAERKAALQTAVGFCEATQTKGLLITAGLEPTRFTNIFPYWNVVDEAREANMCEGRTVGLTIPIEEELQKFMQPRIYTLEELQERPEGVDQSKLETYLCDEEFESLLKMDREDFNKLQAWKQNELKKAVGLF